MQGFRVRIAGVKAERDDLDCANIAFFPLWGVFSLCEDRFLTVVGYLFTFLARPKKVNRKKRV